MIYIFILLIGCAKPIEIQKDNVKDSYIKVTLDCDYDYLCTTIKAELMRRNIEMPYRYLEIKSKKENEK